MLTLLLVCAFFSTQVQKYLAWVLLYGALPGDCHAALAMTLNFVMPCSVFLILYLTIGARFCRFIVFGHKKGSFPWRFFEKSKRITPWHIAIASTFIITRINARVNCFISIYWFVFLTAPQDIVVCQTKTIRTVVKTSYFWQILRYARGLDIKY